MSRWARFGLLAELIAVAGQSFWALWFGRTVHQAFNDVQLNNGQVTQVTGVSFSVGAYFELFLLVAGGVSILFLVWQHSAATVARGLGYPARCSPGFGVGSWFIPVISLWYPYWALSDTLPPDHPLRPRCLWAWLAYLGSGFAGTVALFVALASTTAAIIPISISLALAVTAIAIGTTLIAAVTEDHRARLVGT
jgi:hypothetical protein